MRIWILPAALIATPLAAQRDPGLTAQGQVIAGTMRGHAERDARRMGYRGIDDYRTAQTCRNARRMARPTGARGAKLDQLRALCRRGGY